MNIGSVLFDDTFPDTARTAIPQTQRVAMLAATGLVTHNNDDDVADGVIATEDAAAVGRGHIESYINSNREDGFSDGFDADRRSPRPPVCGADGPDAVPPPPEREYISLVGISDAAIASDTEPTTNPQFCFRCVMGKRMRGNTSSTHIDAMDELIDTQFMDVCPDVLASRVQSMYNRHLRPLIAEPEMRLPWRLTTIWEHITNHAKNPAMEAKHFLRVTGAVLGVLATQNLVYKGTTPGQLKIDSTMMRLFASISKDYLRGLAAVTSDASVGLVGDAARGAGKRKR